MILPAFVLIADLAAWWLFNDVIAFGDALLTTMCFGLALAFLVWLLIEVYQAYEQVRAPGDPDDGYGA